MKNKFYGKNQGTLKVFQSKFGINYILIQR